jgi:hypothetical protein
MYLYNCKTGRKAKVLCVCYVYVLCHGDDDAAQPSPAR